MPGAATVALRCGENNAGLSKRLVSYESLLEGSLDLTGNVAGRESCRLRLQRQTQSVGEIAHRAAKAGKQQQLEDCLFAERQPERVPRFVIQRDSRREPGGTRWRGISIDGMRTGAGASLDALVRLGKPLGGGHEKPLGRNSRLRNTTKHSAGNQWMTSRSSASFPRWRTA
jgi:hypothetical protein